MINSNNPLIQKSDYKYGAVPFNEIKLKHFLPALEIAIKKAENTLDSVKNYPEEPTFENTILVIEEGKIIEKGTHKELLSIKGHYFNLYNNQIEEEKNTTL